MNGHLCGQAEILGSISNRSAGGDVMNWHRCDQAEIMVSIAARGRPRGCYDVMML